MKNLCAIEVLTSSVGNSSAVECFEVGGFFLKYFPCCIHCVFVLVEFEVGLCDVELENLQQCLCVCCSLVVDKINSFLVAINCSLGVALLQMLVSSFFELQSLSQLLLIAVLPLLLLLVLEVQQLNLELQSGVGGDLWR
jgi:hypothetical protein